MRARGQRVVAPRPDRAALDRPAGAGAVPEELQPGQRGFGDLLTTVRQDRISHGRNVFAPGFQTLAVHRFGVWQENLPAPVRLFTRQLFGVLNGYVRNYYGMELAATVKVGRHVTLGHQHGIVIHPFSTIGDHCVLRHGVSLAAATGQTNYDRWRTEAPTLGARVKVGVGAVLMGAIHVGDDTRIGPNVVLTRSVPARSTVVVAPPRIVSAPVPDRPARASRGTEVAPAAPSQTPGSSDLPPAGEPVPPTHADPGAVAPGSAPRAAGPGAPATTT